METLPKKISTKLHIIQTADRRLRKLDGDLTDARAAEYCNSADDRSKNGATLFSYDQLDEFLAS